MAMKDKDVKLEFESVKEKLLLSFSNKYLGQSYQ
jgi:hypothetical protein